MIGRRAAQIAAALEEAQEKGSVHRDLTRDPELALVS